jgi:hypothetical protein
MGAYRRKDSSYWWLLLEQPDGQKPLREPTRIPVEGGSPAQNKELKRQAQAAYAGRMAELDRERRGLPPTDDADAASSEDAPAPLTFDGLADWYDPNVIEHHKGKERERQILPRLRQAFGPLPLPAIDRARVTEWRTQRLATPTIIERFGARGSAVAMWRRIHAYLTAHGPTSLEELRRVFHLSARNVCRTYLRPETEQYFTRVERGLWAAIGNPPNGTTRTLPPPSPRTVNREIDLLKEMLQKAVELGYLVASPLVGMKRLRVTKPKRRLLSDAELARLLEVADPIDSAIILLGHDGLLRFGDILDVRRSDVNGRWAYIADPKDPVQGEPFELPLSPRTLKALRAIPATTGEYFFARYRVAATDRDRRKAWCLKLEKLCKAAGVPYGRKHGGITFHWATRRTGASKLIAQGKDLKTVQALGNWKHPELVLEIYTETERRRLLKAVHRVPARARLQSRINHAAAENSKKLRKIS